MGLVLEVPVNSRFIKPPPLPFPEGLDEDIWKRARLATNTDKQDSLLPSPYTPLTSHTLLAACQRDELSYEERISADHYYGAFTTLLLDLLRQPGRNLTETTYIGLFHTMERQENKTRLPMQTPYVEGDNKTRILFSMTDLGRQFPVLSSTDETFSVPAGAILGVNEKTLFTIKSGDDRFEGLKPIHVLPLSSRFEKLDGISLKDDSRAYVTKWDLPHIKVFVQQSSNASGPSDSLDYDVVISHWRLESPDGRMKLERRDGLIPRYAESVISFTPREATLELSNTDSHISHIIDAVTRFNFHLFQNNSKDIGDNRDTSKDIGDRLHVKLERLSCGDGHWQPVKDGKDFFASGEPVRPKPNINIGPKVTAAVEIVDSDALYGLTLSVDNPRTSLFPYVFVFYPATYEIAVREIL
jgi:hypothetical protein